MISAGLLVLALVAGGGVALQWQETGALRREIGWLKEEGEALARLRAENERLKAAAPPATEVERLRADRAAMLRLRAEIEAMKARAEAKR